MRGKIKHPIIPAMCPNTWKCINPADTALTCCTYLSKRPLNAKKLMIMQKVTINVFKPLFEVRKLDMTQ